MLDGYNQPLDFWTIWLGKYCGSSKPKRFGGSSDVVKIGKPINLEKTQDDYMNILALRLMGILIRWHLIKWFNFIKKTINYLQLPTRVRFYSDFINRK